MKKTTLNKLKYGTKKEKTLKQVVIEAARENIEKAKNPGFEYNMRLIELAIQLEDGGSSPTGEDYL